MTEDEIKQAHDANLKAAAPYPVTRPNPNGIQAELYTKAGIISVIGETEADALRALVRQLGGEPVEGAIPRAIREQVRELSESGAKQIE